MIYILIGLVVLYFLMIRPNLKRDRIERMKSFEKVMITHRGFFDNDKIPENSLKAFEKTVLNGYGTELDVQLTLDNKLVVFHDVSLKRMCGIDKKLTDCTYKELSEYKLLNTEERIPLFKDVLDVLKEDTPLIVEIKPEGRALETLDYTVELLKEYKRNYTIESFNPYVVYRLKKKYPEIIRGILTYNYLKNKEKDRIFLHFICTYLLFNFLIKPDYVAEDINNIKNLSFKIISKIYNGECVAWTLKSQADYQRVNGYYKQFIFDSYVPDSE